MSATERAVTSLLDLQGRVAIVTGASGWLGSAMSRALAEAGATVVVTSRDAEKASQFAVTLSGDSHVGLGLNPGDDASVPGFIAEVVRRLGRVDVLVNNAYGATSPSIDDATAEDFGRSYNVGLTAYFMLAREVMRHLRQREAPGSIINVASMYGVVGSYPSVYEGVTGRNAANYHAAKGAVVQLTRYLAVHWAPLGIRVNAISPGSFARPEGAARFPGLTERLMEKVPLGRIGRPEDLKGAVVLLASDAGNFITGQNLLVDGGWTAW